MIINKSPITLLKSLGDKRLAQFHAERAFKNVKAYAHFLEGKGLTTLPAAFETLPLMNKQNYLLASNYFELLADDHHKETLYLRSSNLKNSFFWPQYNTTAMKGLLLRSYAELNYNIYTAPTACIIAASLGSWAGGTSFAYYAENVSDITEYPFSVFTAGNNIDEIIEFILKYEPLYEQFLLVLCPSFITYILDTVDSLGLHAKFPFHKLRFSTLGEPFNESFREHLDTLCCPAGAGVATSMLSIYGSADTDLLGAESQASAAIRKLLYQDKSLATKMGYNGILPNFFHFYAIDYYIEEIGGDLCITKWQGIPLIRYNLHDSIQLYPWKELRAFILAHRPDNDQNKALYDVIQDIGDHLPDIVALFGRSDSNLKLKGSLIAEVILDNVIQSKPLTEFLTGHYKASAEYDEHDHQYLRLLVETKKSTKEPSPELFQFLYQKIIEGLCDLQHEFKKDYEEIYKQFDQDPEKCVLRLGLCKWPELSQELFKKTKRRGLV
ncbi:hypothetical protein [Candidatus Finniella inopinata]|uniref:Phenylacetate--CoA ligase family protein n=1 Tax=Candidatus Finniella inopinata TaxID=1696036 RepID=A0A4Q7DMP2_9PROT|nr:hypothetical protein [Candidatus Finniella inopinata]RZI46086.1 hypothetical protein EQU50_03910 [Candidatus Finniella inopinata]